MVQHHKWSYDVLMNMIPWERDVNVYLTLAYLKEENERIKLKQQTGSRK